jgi:hypothetical protein
VQPPYLHPEQHGFVAGLELIEAADNHLPDEYHQNSEENQILGRIDEARRPLRHARREEFGDQVAAVNMGESQEGKGGEGYPIFNDLVIAEDGHGDGVAADDADHGDGGDGDHGEAAGQRHAIDEPIHAETAPGGLIGGSNVGHRSRA